MRDLNFTALLISTSFFMVGCVSSPKFTKRYESIVTTSAGPAIMLDVSAQLVPNVASSSKKTMASLDPVVQGQALRAISRKVAATPEAVTKLLGSKIGASKPATSPTLTTFKKRIALQVDLPFAVQAKLTPADRLERLDTTIMLAGSKTPRITSWSKLVCPEVTVDIGDLTFKQTGSLGATAGFDTLSPDLATLEVKGDLARELTETVRLRETRLACYGVPDGSSARVVQTGVLGRRITGVQTIDLTMKVDALTGSPVTVVLGFKLGKAPNKSSFSIGNVKPPANCHPVTITAKAQGLFRQTLLGDDTVTESDDIVVFREILGSFTPASAVTIIKRDELRTKYWFIKMGGNPLLATLPGAGGSSVLRFLSIGQAESFLTWMGAQTSPPAIIQPAKLSISAGILNQAAYQNATIDVGILNSTGPNCP